MMRTLGETAGRESAVHPPPNPRNDRPLVLMLFAAMALGLSVGTQFVAWRFAFHPNLGTPLVLPGDRTLRLLRAAAFVLIGCSVFLAVKPPLRRMAAPLAAASLCIGAASLGPLYAPYQIVLW